MSSTLEPLGIPGSAGIASEFSPQAAYFGEAVENLLKKYEETKKGKKCL
ncbi:MAG TPA: hypothetical protein VGN07_22430 [Steroidobacteraceae bacterium]|jgi:hypothetical protein